MKRNEPVEKPTEEVTSMDTHTDPVCGMQVEKQTAAARSEYQGQEYYFCSEGCKSKFDREPEKYAGGEAGGASR